ncbi:MAG: hypothetical protein ACK5N8_01570 [Alphaproteobacteria bacterium]
MIDIVVDWLFVKHPENIKESSYTCEVTKKPNFDKALLKLRDGVLKKYPSITQKPADKKALWLSYDEHRHLILNDVFLITNARQGFNDRLLEYLIENPNKSFTRDDLITKNVIKSDDTSDFYVFFQGIKLGDELRSLFFPQKYLSKGFIYLKNPILFKDLTENKLNFVDLNKLLKLKK